MRKNYFTKALSAILVLVMVLSVMTILPLTANAAVLPYDMANEGDLLYKFDFSGKDGVFTPDYISSGADKHTYTVTADGYGFNVKGDGTAGSGKNMWGGVVEGYDLSATGVYTMIYKVRANATYATDKTSAQNNSTGIGAWVYDLAGSGYYNNYSNHNTKFVDDVSMRRAALSQNDTKIEDYAMFNDTNNTIVPLNDADGFMTTMLVYDGPQAKMTVYVLVSGDGSKEMDWKKVQESSKTMMDTEKPAQLGFIIYSYYDVVDTDVKDVCVYKGDYISSSTTLTFNIATADDLMGLQAKIDALDNAIEKIRVALTADIDMTDKAFTPINLVKTEGEGDTAVTYEKSVIFVGNGKTIKNLTIGSELVPVDNAALFSNVGADSSFVGVRIDNITVWGTNAAAALVANAEYGDMNFTNIIIGGKITSTAGNAGSLIAKTPKCDPKTEVQYVARYCVNNANVTGFGNTGGMFGDLNGPISFTVEYCANTGNIAVTNVSGGTDQNDSVGGILGRLSHGNSVVWAHQLFKYCYNTGDFSVADVPAQAAMGGIVGDLRQYGKGTGHPHGDAPFGNTFEMIGCFDYDSNRAFPGGDGNNHGGLTAVVARSETPALVYTDCYALPSGATPYTKVAYTTKDNHVFTNVGLVTSADQTINMSTGKTSFGDMIERLETAIATLSEVVLPMGSFSDGKDRDYTWFYNEGALVEKGTEAAPYEIATAAQWAAFSALSNGFQDRTLVGGLESKVDFDGKYFKLTGDIDLTGYEVAPIGGKYPTIHLDGNGKSIANATIVGGGLFSTLGIGSEIKNLTLKNVDVSSSIESGVLAGSADCNLTLYNVKTDADCSVVTTSGIAGGLIGTVLASVDQPGLFLKLQFCVNEASITTNGNSCGGLIGNVTGSINATLEYCVNKGALTQTDLDETPVMGGMIASMSRGLNDTVHYFKNCYNTGKITALSSQSTYCWIGGVLGDLRGALTNGSETYFINCIDNSAREIAHASGSHALLGNADGEQMYKEYIACYGANAVNTVNAYAALAGEINNSEFDNNSMIVFEGLEQEIRNQWGMKSTVLAEMAAIDNAIATLTEMEKPVCEHAYDNACDDDCNLCGEKRVPADHVYDNDQDATCNVCGDERKIQGTTTEPDNQQPDNQQPDNQQPGTENNGGNTTEEKKGCGGSVNALYAVIALTAIVGVAFVAKKREEN